MNNPECIYFSKEIFILHIDSKQSLLNFFHAIVIKQRKPLIALQYYMPKLGLK